MPLSRPVFRDWGIDKDLDAEGKKRYKLAIQRMRLYEDGKLIGPGVFSHALIMKNGIMGWSCKGGGLMMATPDNSHPAANGRKYVFKYTSEKDWKWENKPSFNEKLKQIRPYPDISRVSGRWCAFLENESPDPVLVLNASKEVRAAAAAALKRHTLTENGRPLKGWHRNQNIVIFKTSDGSDPRTNGREYRFIYRNK